MRAYFAVAVSCLAAFFSTVPAHAQQSLTDQVLQGCKTELETHCSGVTPGEGRIVACLYAYEDKLSSRCEYAVYDAAAQLERAISALSYVANECRSDLEKFCSGVAAGQGRLVACIDGHAKELSARCAAARKDTGLAGK
ncbi:MAG TPA: cysteine rich repeat-containing protein [Myxococcota bacterium]|jgi:hypothetical protein|nr:cysteine rich repeat-containing protein [Myxococcota bacterium]